MPWAQKDFVLWHRAEAGLTILLILYILSNKFFSKFRYTELSNQIESNLRANKWLNRRKTITTWGRVYYKDGLPRWRDGLNQTVGKIHQLERENG